MRAFPAPLRSLLMYVAVEGLVQPRWTDMIHEEWMRNVMRDYPDISRAQAERIRDLMNKAIPDGNLTGHEPLIPSLILPDPDDRHVLAAAIQARADVIVTCNLRDFPTSALNSHHIEAAHPDEFLAELFDAAPGPVCTAVKRQREPEEPAKDRGRVVHHFRKPGLSPDRRPPPTVR